jgi:hypothetical protein
LSNIDTTELSDLDGVLQGIKPNINEEDKRRWIADPSGNFSVHSCYNLLVSSNQIDMVDHNVIRALNDLWLNDIPSKIGVSGWRLMLNKLATREDLFNKGIITNIINRSCVFCCCISEN